MYCNYSYFPAYYQMKTKWTSSMNVNKKNLATDAYIALKSFSFIDIHSWMWLLCYVYKYIYA